MVICAEIGFIVSLVVLVLALISIRSKWKAVVAAGSLIIAYLWFSDIAWWVMVK